MKRDRGYTVIPVTFNRRAVIASASVTKQKNTIHCITEVDITKARRLIQEHFEMSGEKLSLTAYIVCCLAQVIKDYPLLNSFHKGRRQIILKEVTVNVLIERDIQGEKVPESFGINQADSKTFYQIHKEIREAQKQTGNRLGSLSGITWLKFIPGFLLRTFIRLADRNITMAKRYGKVCVTAVGMFNKDAIWFIPHGSATVLVTVGGINKKIVQTESGLSNREFLCLTVSFDHNIVDGSPAARFIKQFAATVQSADLLNIQQDKIVQIGDKGP